MLSHRCAHTFVRLVPHPLSNFCLLLILLVFLGCTKSFAEPYTPGVGSPERVAIANAVRASVAQLGDQFAKDARRGAKFVIAVLKIEGRYAFFEGGGTGGQRRSDRRTR